MASNAEKIAIYQELERRGEIPADKVEVWNEIKRRMAAEEGAQAQGAGIGQDISAVGGVAKQLIGGGVAEVAGGLSGIVGGVLPGEQGQALQYQQEAETFVNNLFASDNPQSRAIIEGIGKKIQESEAAQAAIKGFQATGQYLGDVGAGDKDSIEGGEINVIGGTIGHMFPQAALEVAGAGGGGLAAKGLVKGAPVVKEKLGEGTDKIKDFAKSKLSEKPAPEEPSIAEQLKSETEAVIEAVDTPETLAATVMPDPEKVAAFKAQGMLDDALSGYISSNPSYVALESAVKSTIASPLKAQENLALIALGKRADEFITKYGGDTDLSEINRKIETDMEATSSDLFEQENLIYDGINAGVKSDSMVIPQATLNYLSGRNKSLGGAQYLPSAEKKVWSMLKDNPTYSRLDQVRKEIGTGIKSNTGDFKDMNQGTLKNLYEKLSDDQGRFLHEYNPELKAEWDKGKAVVRQRVVLDNSRIALFGQKLDKSMLGQLKTGIEKLSKEDYKAFNKVVNQIPENHRQSAIISGIHYGFTKGMRKQDPISPASYVDWFEGLQKNKTSRDVLYNHLDANAKKDLKDLYIISKGMNDSMKENITTGRIQAIKDSFDIQNNIMDTVLEGGKQAAKAGVYAKGGFFVGNPISKMIDNAGKKDPIEQRATDLIVDVRFQRLSKAIAEGEPPEKINKFMQAVTKTKEFKEWVNTLPDAAKEAANDDLVSFLTQTKEAAIPATGAAMGLGAVQNDN